MLFRSEGGAAAAARLSAAPAARRRPSPHPRPPSAPARRRAQSTPAVAAAWALSSSSAAAPHGPVRGRHSKGSGGWAAPAQEAATAGRSRGSGGSGGGGGIGSDAVDRPLGTEYILRTREGTSSAFLHKTLIGCGWFSIACNEPQQSRRATAPAHGPRRSPAPRKPQPARRASARWLDRRCRHPTDTSAHSCSTEPFDSKSICSLAG